jgi:hypothetical protein
LNKRFKHYQYQMIRALVPRALIRKGMDVMEFFKRRVPGQQTGIPKYNIGPTQVYPNGTNFIPTLKTATKEKLFGVELTSTTPVASIGTCFAEKFAYFMKEQGYHYITTEKDALAASANWGRVYTIPNLLQIVRYSMDKLYPLVVEECSKGWFDPLRESHVPFFKTRKEAEDSILAHRAASHKALTTCQVLIITLGQNEAWMDSSNDQVWAKMPPQEILASRRSDFSVTEFSFEKNLVALKEVIHLLMSMNPNIKILFTVSPVSPHAIFTDKDIISQSFANKCILRAVVNEAIALNSERLFYFPSFEMVLCNNPYNYCADNRHVKRATVDRIFSLFTDATLLN